MRALNPKGGQRAAAWCDWCDQPFSTNGYGKHRLYCMPKDKQGEKMDKQGEKMDKQGEKMEEVETRKGQDKSKYPFNPPRKGDPSPFIRLGESSPLQKGTLEAITRNPRLMKNIPRRFVKILTAGTQKIMREFMRAHGAKEKERTMDQIEAFLDLPSKVVAKGRTVKQARNWVNAIGDEEESTNKPAEPPTSGSIERSEEERLRLKVSSLVSHRYMAKAARLAQGGLGKVAEKTVATLHKLRVLNPWRNVRESATREIKEALMKATKKAVDKYTLKETIRKSDNGSSGGPSGGTGFMLRKVAEDEEVLEGLALLVSLIINGEVEGVAKERLLASRLIPFLKDKEDSNGSVRPVAMGETINKVAGRYILELVETGEYFCDFQYGFKVKGGAEVVRNIVGLCLDGNIVSIDIENAFNETPRKVIFEELLGCSELEPLWRYVLWSYEEPSALAYEGGALLSTHGIRQGDPLSPLLFALVVAKAQREVAKAGGRSSAYLDDVYIHGEGAGAGTRAYIKAIKEMGFRLNEKKSFVYSRTGNLEIKDLPTKVTTDVMEVMKVPVYEEVNDEVREAAKAKVVKAMEGLDRVANLGLHPIALFPLIDHCISASVSHLLRALTPGLARDVIKDYDIKVREVAGQALEADEEEQRLYPQAMERMCRATGQGGLGLRVQAWKAPMAYLAGLATAIPTVFRLFGRDKAERCLKPKVEEAYRLLPEGCKAETLLGCKPVAFFDKFSDPKNVRPGLQAKLTRDEAEREMNEVVSEWNTSTQKRHRECCDPSSWAFLSTATRVGNLYHIFSDRAIIRAARTRIGLPSHTYQAFDSKCPLCRAEIPDTENYKGSGMHFVTSCPVMAAQRTKRHNVVGRALQDLMQKMPNVYSISHEPKDILEEFDLRPDMRCRLKGIMEAYLLDVTVTSRMVTQLERWKREKYDGPCRLKGHRFVPIAITSYGEMGRESIVFFKKLARGWADELPGLITEEEALATIISRLSFELQVANAGLIDDAEVRIGRLRDGGRA